MILRSILLFIVACLSTSSAVAEDRWAYLGNSYLRIGVNESQGACITFFAPRGSEENLLDHYDSGRFIQQSYYGDPDGSKWVEKPWVYNPVQGGSYRNEPSKVTKLPSEFNSLAYKITPRNWAGGQLLSEVTMHETISLDGYFAKIDFQMHYAGKKTHKPRHQELPAVFVNAQYETLVTYSGDSPWTGQELHRRKPGFPNESVTMAENWVAYVNQDDFGIGIYVHDIEQATCYRYQEAKSACSYVAPIKTFALTPGLKHQYTVYLTCGPIDQIRLRFRLLHASIIEAAKEPPASNSP